MLHDGWLWGILGLFVVAVLVAAVLLSPNKRLRRRLRKIHNSRIVSKAQRPTVKFSVRTPRIVVPDFVSVQSFPCFTIRASWPYLPLKRRSVSSSTLSVQSYSPCEPFRSIT